LAEHAEGESAGVANTWNADWRQTGRTHEKKMIKRISVLTGLVLVLLPSFAQGQASQAAGAPHYLEHHITPEQRAALDQLNAESCRVNKTVQPLLKKARELADAGNLAAASRYYEMAATNQRTVWEGPADSILEESLVAQGKYTEAAGIGRQYGPTTGQPIWLIISDCEIGQVDEARRLLAANWCGCVGVNYKFEYELPIGSDMNAESIEATALLFLVDRQGLLHSPQARFSWLRKANALCKHNALIELRMAELLNGPLRQPSQALALLEDAKRHMGAGPFEENDPLEEVDRQYQISIGFVRQAALAAKALKDR
jgi:hypothetical protein